MPWGTRPNGGLNPTTPQQEAGIRIEPPISEPLARLDVQLANDAAAPPDEPPTSNAKFQGLRVTPHRREWVNGMQENSGVLVRA